MASTNELFEKALNLLAQEQVNYDLIIRRYGVQSPEPDPEMVSWQAARIEGFEDLIVDLFGVDWADIKHEVFVHYSQAKKASEAVA